MNRTWEQGSKEMEMVVEGCMTAEEALGIKKPATEETLHSIDSTMKRIEAILLLAQNQLSALAGQVPLEPK